MKRYTVEVNGSNYNVVIKEGAVGGTAAPQPVQTNNQVNNTETTQTTNVTAADAEAIKAPMTGAILSIKVNEGDVINKGDTVLTLEAMKMETEVSSPVSGKVLSIKAKEGENCESGSVLALIEGTR